MLLRIWSSAVSSRSGMLLSKTFVKFPVAISASFVTIRYTVADALVQISEIRNDNRNNWNYPRSVAFTMFGLYCGVCFGKIYTKYYAMLLDSLLRRNIKKIPAVIGITVFDCTVCSVVLYYPMYYTIQEFCHTGQFDPLKAVRTTRDNMVADIRAMSSFFGPLTMFNLLFVPVHLRAICVAMVSNIWAIIISKMRGDYIKANEGIEKDVVIMSVL